MKFWSNPDETIEKELRQHVSYSVVDLEVGQSGVKAVTFDLWETLLFERDGSNSERTVIRCEGLVRVLNRLGLNASVEDVAVALKETMCSLVRIWDKNKDLSHADQIRLFVKHTSKAKLVLTNGSLRKLGAAYVSPLFEVPPYLNPDACEALEWLRNQKKRVGVICNTGMIPGTELRRLLSRAGVAEYFRTMIFSNEVGVRKPDRRIFSLAAQRLRAEPHEIVHVGDNLKSDVWGAKNAGFRAIHLSSVVGRDKIADSDPASLVSLSRNLGSLGAKWVEPDKTISSLSMVKKAIEELEASL